MRIGEQILAVPSSYLARSTSAIQRSLERLSSGKRVNSAADDSAAFSAGIRLDSQARGLKQGLLNINQSQSLLEVADSAYSTQLDLIQRMREIAVEASNGTLTTADRTNLNKELNALVEEFQRIATQTEFNGRNLIDGSFGTLSTFSGLGNSSIDQSLQNSQLNQMFKKTAGTATFNWTQTITEATSTNRGVETADVNNDGKLDLVYLHYSSQTAITHLGNGDGTFQSAITSAVMEAHSTATTVLQLGDLNGDGIKDYVGVSLGLGLVVATGTGDGRFQFRATYGSNAVRDDIRLADIDDDGDLDAITSEGITANTISIFTNDGTGTFTFAKSWAPTAGARSIQIADFNNDGKLDIATTNSLDLSISLNQGGFNFSHATATGLGAFVAVADQLAVGDIDNDGDTDIGLNQSSTRVMIFLNDGVGAFTYSAANSPTTTGLAIAPRFMDVNNDGVLDIVGAESLTGYIWTALGKGNGTFNSFTTSGMNTGGQIADAVFADFNGDGIPDMAFGMRSGSNSYAQIQNTAQVSATSDLSVATQAKAQKLIGILDTALANITGAQSDISALHARLDSEASASLMLAENLSDALSRSQDVDVAEETSELVRNQILQQAQIAVMAQANTQAQVVLNLLRDL